jgi:hypothetical protein
MRRSPFDTAREEPVGGDIHLGSKTTSSTSSPLGRGIERIGREGQSFKVPCSTSLERSVGLSAGVPYRPAFAGLGIFGVA